MIPANLGFLDQDFEIEQQPSKTYQMILESGRIQGYTDGLEAVKQAVYKILLTERYRYIMYSWNYGIELQDLFGEPVSYVCPELKRRITEALTQDDRIEDVDEFEFDLSRKGLVHVSFLVHTIYGEIQAEREVEI